LVVCVFLGLWIVEEEVNFEVRVPGLVNHLFEDNDITVNMIVVKLSDITINMEENVDDFCKLYILHFVLFKLC